MQIKSMCADTTYFLQNRGLFRVCGHSGYFVQNRAVMSVKLSPTAFL